MTIQQFLFRNRSYTPLPFLSVMIIWASPSRMSLFIGLIVMILGELIRYWGVSYAGSETRTTGGVGASKLVTSGPFGYVRNPLYTGNIMRYMGIGIISNALFPYLQLAAFLYFFLQYYLIIREEESFLNKEFGSEFQQYCRNVPRFIPRIIRYESNSRVDVNWKNGLRSESRTFQAIVAVMILILIRWTLR